MSSNAFFGGIPDLIHLIFTWHRFDASNLPAARVLASCRADMNHGVVLELIRAVENASAVVGASHGKLAVLKVTKDWF